MRMKFDRQEYLALEEIFEVGQLDDVTKELCEFSDDIEDMAYELAYTRYALAKAETRHNALVEAAKSVLEWEYIKLVTEDHIDGDGLCRSLDALAALVGEVMCAG